MSVSIQKNTTVSKDNVFLTSAGTYGFSATASGKPENGSGPTGSPSGSTSVATWKTYGMYEYQFTSSPDSDTRAYSTSSGYSHKFTGLTQGAENTLKVTVTVRVAITNHKKTAVVDKPGTPATPASGTPGQPGYVPAKPAVPATYKWSSDSTSEGGYWSGGSDTVTFVVYTRPGSFSYDCAVEHIIEDTGTGGLSAAKVVQWAIHCGKYLSWFNQAKKYDPSGSTYSYGAKSGGFITAEWFNSSAAACGLSTRVTGGPQGTIITADLINSLGRQISKGDS